MGRSDICSFSGASKNVAMYLGKYKEDSLHLDSKAQEVIEKYKMYKTLFRGQQGLYACTSSKMAGFRNNPLGVDIKSISAISKSLELELRKRSEILMGWHMYDPYGSYFKLSYTSCDSNYYIVDDAPILKLKPASGLVVRNKSAEQLGSCVDVIEKHLPSLLKSLVGVEIPIDLMEVCIASNEYSEEGCETKFPSTYISDGEIGSFSNRTHILNGISVIHRCNGFSEWQKISGGYALLIVQ